MSNIPCCRNIIVLWNLNLIIKDIFDRVRNPHLLTSSPILIWNAVFEGWTCAFGCDAVGV